MDRNFFYQKRAQEHQREISQELTNRNLLKDGGHTPLTTKQAMRLILRIAFAVIIFSLLALYLSG